MTFQEEIRNYSELPFNQQLLLSVLKDYKRPYDKIDELVKQQALIQLKRGLYIPGPTLNMVSPELLLIANHLHGPSYVSLDTALWHWGLIPERVYEISCVTTNLSKTYHTKIGRFSYVHANLPFYCLGIKSVSLTKKQTVLMASPEKALCDKIVYTSGILLRSVKQTRALLIEDFRIDENYLRQLDLATIESWLNDAPKQNSMLTLIKALKNL
jgi:predicted transcriptional regulator of viral defense system